MAELFFDFAPRPAAGPALFIRQPEAAVMPAAPESFFPSKTKIKTKA